MRIWAVLLLAAILVAGCSASPSAGTNSADPEPEFDVKATETTGVIRGLALDEAVRPLPGVTINLTSGASAVTGDDGAFGFEGLAPGDYFLQASKFGYQSVQSAATVVAGVDQPDIVKMQMVTIPSQQPYVEAITRHGFLTFGASVGITSLGSTFFGGIGEDEAIWNIQFTQVPMWAQGELVWEQTQPAGGMLIWEMVKGDGQNTWRGHRETSESPALAYWNTTVLQSEAENVTADGIDYRFFGGPHPLLAPGAGIVPERPSGHPVCTTFPTVVLGDRSLCSFGYGTTVQQKADAYIHNFFNFAPPEGWRFTVDGAPVVPTN